MGADRVGAVPVKTSLRTQSHDIERFFCRLTEAGATWERRSPMETKIKIYTLSTCSHCKATKRFLDECSVQYDFMDVDMLKGEERQAILDDVRKLNPRCSFPTIIIGEKVIVGFKENEIKEALGLS